MCTGCFTSVDAVVVQSTVGVVLARAGLSRLQDLLTGRDVHDRRRAAYEANAGFLAGLGHDPAEVLGPPPLRDPSAAPVVRPVVTAGAVGVVV